LRFTKIRVNWNGELPLHVPSFKCFLVYPNLNEVVSIGSNLIWTVVICPNIYYISHMQIWKKLFKFIQMVSIVPKFEWSCLNYQSMFEAVGICPNLNGVFVYYPNWNEALWSFQNWLKLFEVTQKWTKMFHLAQIWMELLPFRQSWLSLLEFRPTQIFPIYGNISDFTQIWMKLSQIYSNFIEIVKIYPNNFDFIPILIKLL